MPAVQVVVSSVLNIVAFALVVVVTLSIGPILIYYKCICCCGEMMVHTVNRS